MLFSLIICDRRGDIEKGLKGKENADRMIGDEFVVIEKRKRR